MSSATGNGVPVRKDLTVFSQIPGGRGIEKRAARTPSLLIITTT